MPRVERPDAFDSGVRLRAGSVLYCGKLRTSLRRKPACITRWCPRSDSNQHFREET